MAYMTWIFLILFISGYEGVPLLMSATTHIKIFDELDPSNATSLTPTTTTAVAVDYHWARGEFYFSDGLGRIYRSRLTPTGGISSPLVIAEVRLSDGLAVDWIHDYLYWTDVTRRLVEVATLDGLNRLVLFNSTHGLEKPRAIVLDPFKGILFWSDWGEHAKIETSGLDGKQKKTIVNSKLHWPNGLTLDLSSSKLYIVDGFHSQIFGCDYDGSNFKVVIGPNENLLQAFGLTYFANKLYWTTWRARTLFSVNTESGQTTSVFRQTGLKSIIERMMGLKAVHYSLQPKSPTPNPCIKTGCSHHCLVGRGDTATCICPYGFILNDDGKTCAEEGYILVSWRRTIRRYTLHGSNEEPMVDDAKAAISIDYHLKKKLVFWSDVEEHRIYRAVLGQMSNRTVIATPETCDGLAIDWIHDVIYWSDADRNTIEVANLDGSKQTSLFTKDLDQPRALAVDPFEGFLFWCDWGAKPKIERSTLDGLERTVILDKEIAWPNGIAIDSDLKKIYWVDGKLGTISSSSYDGSQRIAIMKPIILFPFQLFSISKFKDQLYWTDWTHQGLYQSPSTEFDTMLMLANSSTILLRPQGVKVVHSSLQRSLANPCDEVKCTSVCLGTKSHRARCMGGESTDTINGTDHIDRSVLIKTPYNDSVHIVLINSETPGLVAIVVKCIKRNYCESQNLCNGMQMTQVFEKQSSFNITGLLPASHYEIYFISEKHYERFTIDTLRNEPPEIPNIKSVEKQGQNVTVKWNPVDVCDPEFQFYQYKLFKSAVGSGQSKEGNTSDTEIVFDNLEPETDFTIQIYTYNAKYYSSAQFNTSLSDDATKCNQVHLLCDGKADCSDGVDEDIQKCAGIEHIIAYEKNETHIYFRIQVTNGTKKKLDKFTANYNIVTSNSFKHFQEASVSCFLWPDSYCFYISNLQPKKPYKFEISAVLKDGRVGKPFNITATTKEEISGPPEELQVSKYTPTTLLLQWEHPNQSNGRIKSFVINLEETETYNEENCCQHFPIIERAASYEEQLYEVELTQLSPAATYAISIAAVNLYFGMPTAIEVSTPPPPMDIIRTPNVEVSSLLPLSWKPPGNPGDLHQYPNLINSYMLLLLLPKNYTMNITENIDVGHLQALLEAQIEDKFVVLWHKNLEDEAAFQGPIKVTSLTPRKQYKLAWVQVTRYKDAYNFDYIFSDPFIFI